MVFFCLGGKMRKIAKSLFAFLLLPILFLCPTVIFAAETDTPVISSVSVSNIWAHTNDISVITTSAYSSYTYAITDTNTSPLKTAAEWQTSSSFSVNTNGIYYAWVKSSSDKISSSKMFQVQYVDITAPTLPVITSDSSDEWAGKNITISITPGLDSQSQATTYCWTTDINDAPDNTGGTADSTRKVIYSAPFVLTKSQVVFSYAQDEAGNKTKTVSKTVLIDLNKPTAPIISFSTDEGTKVNNGQWINKRISASVTGSSSASGISYYEYSIDSGATWTKYAYTTRPFISAKSTFMARAVSVSGVKGEVASFNCYVDLISPTVNIQKKVSDAGTLKLAINPSDYGGSEINKVVIKRAGEVDVELASPYEFIVNQDEILTVVVDDNAGNKTSTEYSAAISLSPGFSYEINYSDTREQAEILVTVTNTFDFMTLPDSTNTTMSQYSYWVSESGTYTFSITDLAGAKKNYSVVVDGVIKSGDSTMQCSITIDGKNSVYSINSTQEVIHLATTGVNGDIQFRVNAEMAKIVSIDTSTVNDVSGRALFSLAANSRQDFVVTVVSGNNNKTKYTITLSTESVSGEISISNKSKIENSTYGLLGYSTGTVFTPYSDSEKKGIVLEFKVKIPQSRQTLRGQLSFNIGSDAFSLAAVWKDINGAEELDVSGGTYTGYVVIPIIYFTSNAVQNVAALTIYDPDTGITNPIAATTIRFSIDVVAPSASFQVNSDNTLVLFAADTNRLVSIEYSIVNTATNTTTATTSYSQPIQLEGNSNYKVTITATDILGNKSVKTVDVSTRAAGDSIYDKGEGSAKYYKSPYAYYYLIGAGQTNTQEIMTDNLQFVMDTEGV